MTSTPPTLSRLERTRAKDRPRSVAPPTRARGFVGWRSRRGDRSAPAAARDASLERVWYAARPVDCQSPERMDASRRRLRAAQVTRPTDHIDDATAGAGPLGRMRITG